MCVTVKLIRRGLDAARRWGVLGLADGILRHATLNLFRVATEVHRVIQVGRLVLRLDCTSELDKPVCASVRSKRDGSLGQRPHGLMVVEAAYASRNRVRQVVGRRLQRRSPDLGSETTGRAAEFLSS